MRVRTYFYLNTVEHRPKNKLFNIALDCLSDITSENPTSQSNGNKICKAN